jgi:hypothetical protein
MNPRPPRSHHPGTPIKCHRGLNVYAQSCENLVPQRLLREIPSFPIRNSWQEPFFYSSNDTDIHSYFLHASGILGRWKRSW